jgi:DNA-binding PadR family transcriptional regulator
MSYIKVLEWAGVLARPVFPFSDVHMANDSTYSELEYLILAMAGDGVSSGYAMRKQMNRMRGGRWSSESGSVYRVLRRLEQDGMVAEARRVGAPNRERTEYELTPAGAEELKRWLRLTPDRSEIAFLCDPIRTRSYFLPRLEPHEQIRIVKGWMQENKAFIADLARDIERSEFQPVARRVAYENLLYLAEARQDWLRKLLTTIKNGEPVAALAVVEEGA